MTRAYLATILTGTTIATPIAAQSIDIPALWQRYLETCTPFVTDVSAATAALEPLVEGAEMSRSADGQAVFYEQGDEDGLVGNHIYVNLAGASSSVHCAVFDYQIGDLGAESLTKEVAALLKSETGTLPTGGVAEVSANPKSGVRVLESNSYWSNFSSIGAFPQPDIVTSAQIQREDYGGVFATGVSFSFYATIPDAP